MAYVDSSGQTHISLSEAASGYTATHTASRDAQGTVVGDSAGSRYVREQEAAKAATPNNTLTPDEIARFKSTLVQPNAQLEAAKQGVTGFAPVSTRLASQPSTRESVLSKARSMGSSALDSASSALGSLSDRVMGSQKPSLVQKARAIPQAKQPEVRLSPAEIAVAQRMFGSTSGLTQRDASGKVSIVAEKKSFSDVQRFKTVDQLNMEKRDVEIAKYKAAHPNFVSQIAADLYGATADKASLQRTEQQANDWVSGNVTSKYLPTTEVFEQKRNAAFTKVGLEDERQVISKKIYDNPLGAAAMNVGVDSYNFVREKPVSATKEVAIIAAEGYVAGTLLGAAAVGGRVGLGAAGKVASKVPVVGGVASSVFTKSARFVEPGMNAGMVGLMGHSIYGDVQKGDYENVVKTAGNIAIGTPGYKAGSRNALKGVDIMRTRGLTEYSAESLVSKEVLTGKSMVPTTEKGTTPESFIQGFETNGVTKGYHATPASFPKQTAALDAPGRGTDMPGLYITPESAGVNIHFTRVAKSESSYAPLVEGFSDVISGIVRREGSQVKAGAGKIGDALIGTPEPLEPTILHVELPSKVERLPENLRVGLGDKNIEASREYIRSEAGTGKTFLTPKLETGLASGGRAETEAVVTPESILTKMNSEGFVKFEGRRIRIDAFKVSEAVREGTVEKTKLFSDHIEAGKADSKYTYERGKEGLVTKIGTSVTPISLNPQINTMLSVTPKSSDIVAEYSKSDLLSSPVSNLQYGGNYKASGMDLSTRMIASVSGVEYNSTPKRTSRNEYSSIPGNSSISFTVTPSESVTGYSDGKNWGKPSVSYIGGVADISNPFDSTQSTVTPPISSVTPPTPRNSVIIPPPKNNPIIPPPSSFKWDSIIIIPPEKKFKEDSDDIKPPKSKKEAYGKRKKQMRNVFGSWEQYNAAMGRVARNKGLKAKNPEDLVKGTRVDIGSTGKLKLKW